MANSKAPFFVAFDDAIAGDDDGDVIVFLFDRVVRPNRMTVINTNWKIFIPYNAT